MRARKINCEYSLYSLNIFISFYKHTYTTCNIVQYNRFGTKAMVLVWFLSSNFEINYTNNNGYKLCNECLDLTLYCLTIEIVISYDEK